MNRFTLPLLVTLVLAGAGAAHAFDASRLSLRANVGAVSPSAGDRDFQALSVYGLGPASGAGLAYRLTPWLSVTADAARSRFRYGSGLVAIPEIRLRKADDATFTSGLAGLEVRTGAGRALKPSLYARLAGGVAALGGGDLHFDDMNGPSFIDEGRSGTFGAMGAAAGVRIPVGIPRLGLDLGVQAVRAFAPGGDITSRAVYAGVEM